MRAAEIVATLARLRKECGATQTDIASLAGFQRDTIRRWEEGHYPAALDLAAAWAAAMGHDLVLIPRAAPRAPSELAELVAALHTAYTTPADEAPDHEKESA